MSKDTGVTNEQRAMCLSLVCETVSRSCFMIRVYDCSVDMFLQIG